MNAMANNGITFRFIYRISSYLLDCRGQCGVLIGTARSRQLRMECCPNVDTLKTLGPERHNDTVFVIGNPDGTRPARGARFGAIEICTFIASAPDMNGTITQSRFPTLRVSKL